MASQGEHCLIKKKRNHERWFLFFAFYSILFSNSTASLYGQTNVRFERITVDDGLSQSSITSLQQDKYGYLWVGTLDGLNRYDGNSFIVYRHNPKKPNSFPARNVSGLFLDRNENLWISYRNGLSRYEQDRDHFKNYKIEVDERTVLIRHVNHVSDSLMLLCTNVGVLHFNPVTGKVNASDTYSQFVNQNVNGVVLGHNTVWVFLDKGIWRKKYNQLAWSKFFTDTDYVRCTYIESSGELYVRTADYLWKYDSLSDKLTQVDSVPQDRWPNSSAIFKTKSNDLWVAHGNISIYDRNDRISKKVLHTPQDPNSLSGAFVSAIYETRDGVVWVGTNGLGLNKYNPSRSAFGYLGNFPGAPLTIADNFITSVYADNDQRILVNTLDGLNVIDLQSRKSEYFPIFTKNETHGRIWKAFKDVDGKIWLTTDIGLITFTGRSIVLSGNPLLDNANLDIYDSEVMGESEFLFSTSQGLLLWDKKKNITKVVYDQGSLVLSRIGNTVWFESAEKLKIMRWRDKQIVKTFVTNGSDSLNAPLASVKCIYQDTDKNIWLGTDGGGLSLYDSVAQTFSHFDEADGLSNTVVYGMLEDQAGHLWLSTNEGLNVFDRKTKRVIRTYNKNDGLQGNEFNTRACFKSPSGKMYFGGVNGLTFFDPDEVLKIPSLTPQTVLTGFYIDNVKQTDFEDDQIASLFNNNTIQLNWQQRNFSFDIAGLGFTFPSGVQYQYKLLNFDRDWNLIGKQNRITFTNMPAGDYVLNIKSANSFGEWEKEGLAITISIVSPLWRSPWFISGVMASVILLIYFFNLQRTSFLKKRAALLQTLVNERTRKIQQQQEEIATQNEELTAQAEALENSNLELEKRVERRTIKLQRLNEELIDQNTQLEQFTFITAHNIRGPIARIHGLINLLSPKNNEEEVIHHLKTSITQLDEVIVDLNAVLNITHGVNKTFEPIQVKEQLLVVLSTLQEDIGKVGATINTTGFENVKVLGLNAYFQSIFFHLIHNALKYSSQQTSPLITCGAKIIDDCVVITIEDNGVGIDMRYAKDKIFKLHQRFHPNVIGRGVGLFLVKTQVKAMHGLIDVESELGLGTRFTIRFPKIKDD